MMRHARNTTRQDSEPTVIKANRKHQIVLNMEVKRIEMEKKMRERYFCFEMSLMKARRLKIVDRQKSLGIYHPHTMENGQDSRKEGGTDSFFFTQSVALDSKVKLPPVLERRKTISGFPSKLATSEEPRKLNKLAKNIDHNNFSDKERAKRFDKMRRSLKDGHGQSQTHSKIIKESSKLDERKADNEGKNNKNKKDEFCGSAEVVLNKDLIVQKDKLQLDGKNLAADVLAVKQERNADEVKEREFSEKIAPENEQNSGSNCNNPGQHSSKENYLEETCMDVAKLKTSSTKLIQLELTSTQTQSISDFPSYLELQAWRSSLETRSLNSQKDAKATNRLKSASAAGNRKYIDIDDATAVKVRPQTAFARLLQDERKSC